MRSDHESTSLLGQGAAAAAAMATSTTSTASTALTVAGLFFGALLASIDVAYNIATYTYVGSEFNLVEYGFWFLIIHEIVHAFVQPIYGSLSTTYGRKPLILAALGIFTAGAAISGISSTFFMAISGRVISSVGVSGTAILVTFTLADMVPLRTFALLQSGHSICETVGLIVGAMIGSQTNKDNWRLLYRINTGLILLPLVWLWLVMPAPTPITAPVPDDSETITTMTATLPPSSPATRPKFDILGAITLAATVSSIFLAIEFSDTKWGVSIFLRILLYVFTVLSFIAFLYVETRPSSQKVVPLRYMKAGIVRNSILCYSLIMFLYTASIYQTSFYLQVLRYDDEAESTLGLSPLYMGLGIGFLCGGTYIRATGNARGAILSSATLTVVCYGLLASTLIDIGQHSDQILLVLLGTALAVSFEGLIVSLISRSERTENASLISMNGVLGSICGTFGTKISAAFFKFTTAQVLHSKFQDPGLSQEIMFKLFHNLDELRSFSPEIRQVVVASVRQASEILHIPICALAIVAALATLGLRPRV